jgi:hypothetical protein
MSPAWLFENRSIARIEEVAVLPFPDRGLVDAHGISPSVEPEAIQAWWHRSHFANSTPDATTQSILCAFGDDYVPLFLYARSTCTDWSIDAPADELDFLGIPSAKLKKVTQARPAYASAFSLNIRGRTSLQMVSRVQEGQTFATQPEVKFQWDQVPSNPQTTIPLTASTTKINLEPQRFRTKPYSAPCLSTKPHPSHRRRNSLTSRNASIILRSATPDIHIPLPSVVFPTFARKLDSGF